MYHFLRKISLFFIVSIFFAVSSIIPAAGFAEETRYSSSDLLQGQLADEVHKQVLLHAARISVIQRGKNSLLVYMHEFSTKPVSPTLLINLLLERQTDWWRLDRELLESQIISISIQRKILHIEQSTKPLTGSELRPVSVKIETGVAQWRSQVTKYFPKYLVEDALSVMWCESRGLSNATSPVSDARGLFQHKLKYWKLRADGAGFENADVFEAEANIAAAAWLVDLSVSQGKDPWEHWACKP